MRGTNTYRVTPHGRSIATFLTVLAARVIIPALTDLEHVRPTPPAPRPLTAARRDYQRRLDELITAAGLAA